MFFPICSKKGDDTSTYHFWLARWFNTITKNASKWMRKCIVTLQQMCTINRSPIVISGAWFIWRWCRKHSWIWQVLFTFDYKWYEINCVFYTLWHAYIDKLGSVCIRLIYKTNLAKIMGINCFRSVKCSFSILFTSVKKQ